MPKSLLALQNDRRKTERRHFSYERRNLPDRREKSVPVSEERRENTRRTHNDRRKQDRRMGEFQKNIMKKEVLEKEEHALITSRGIDEEEMEDNRSEIKEAATPKYERIYEDDLASGERPFNITTIVIAICSILIATLILYQFVFI
jgi:hypothetical protein